MTGTWVWLFPLSQSVHVAEEYLEGYGFHRRLSDLTHTPFSLPHVLLMHVGFILAMVAVTVPAARRPAWGWVVPGLAILVLLNAFSHIVVSAMSSSASSGLASSLLLWVPLGVTALIRAWRGLDRFRFWSGLAAGAAAQLPVSWVALRAGRL